jgi:exonuclease VII small subunit
MNKDIKRVEEDKDSEIKRLNNIADKLEKRIATLEKVLESHAKCIGAIRKICDE